MGEESVIELTDATFDQFVGKEDQPVFVMFSSPTCPYCRAMEPYFRGYAKEFEGVVTFGICNIVTNQWTAERFGIRGTPTFKIFCGGKPFMELVGGVYPALLKRMIEDALKSGTACVKASTSVNYDITGYG